MGNNQSNPPPSAFVVMKYLHVQLDSDQMHPHQVLLFGNTLSCISLHSIYIFYKGFWFSPSLCLGPLCNLFHKSLFFGLLWLSNVIYKVLWVSQRKCSFLVICIIKNLQVICCFLLKYFLLPLCASGYCILLCTCGNFFYSF